MFIYRSLAQHYLFGETDMDEDQFTMHYKAIQTCGGNPNKILAQEFNVREYFGFSEEKVIIAEVIVYSRSSSIEEVRR